MFVEYWGRTHEHFTRAGWRCYFDPTISCFCVKIFNISSGGFGYISVKAFANRVNHLPQLDVLINNAGISAEKFSLVYGTERTLGVNVIGTFLLSLLVLPKLRETAKKFNTTPHMTFVGSAMHSTANYPKKFDGDFFTWSCEKENVNLNNQYALSKYIQLLLVNKLASHIDPLPSTTSKESNKIIINSLDPCFCGTTGLFRDVSGGKRIFLKIFNLFSRTPEKGSRLIVGAAAAGRETHGGWLRAGEVRETVEMVRGVEGVERGERVWRDLVGRVEGLGVGVGGLVEG
ncbi:putative Short-chain dehydrogenase TIC 32, chloroplastic [Glarea lozoyensis 74030]|uniref:Putative Short-chain dehydrogenase TIC 32, chloroplastic n=1 Tax=Glarea lozoyensis (strain ATCC 74030 / MF5533) TaxID=1104152 RepID=H0ENV2_GLAL7|nr:putative Short-chain dehydrogenase TIC 32, chloroplastic [Glarea lozoyensis 74030]